MRGPRLLVTGFGPFPGVPDNPAATLVRAIAARDLPGVSTALLPTEWGVCDLVAERAHDVDGVIMFGVAAREWRIRYERVSLPFASQAPDAAGCLPPGPPPQSRRSALDVRRLVRTARAAGFDVRLSHSPGGYICNASYGAALSANRHSIFVHIPQPVARSRISGRQLEVHAQWLIGAVGTMLGGRL